MGRADPPTSSRSPTQAASAAEHLVTLRCTSGPYTDIQAAKGPKLMKGITLRWWMFDPVSGKLSKTQLQERRCRLTSEPEPTG